jgi:hypothetical protein
MVRWQAKPPLTSIIAGHRLEAAEGFEPSSRALQAPNYPPLTSTYAKFRDPLWRIHATQRRER